MDKFDAMQAFVGVVDAGNFTRAAERLDLPRPTVTRFVQQTEKQLRIKLLHRTTRQMTVTEEGRRYYEGAVRLLGEVDALESSVTGADTGPAGPIRVEVPSTLSKSVLAPALPDFCRRYPAIRVELKVNNQSGDLIARHADCAIRIGPIVDDSLIAHRLADLAFCAVASPAYLKAQGRPDHPRELAEKHTVVEIVSPRTGRRFARTLDSGEEQVRLQPGRKVSVDDATTALAMSAAGVGIAVSYERLAQPYLSSGDLVRLFDGWDCGRAAVRIAYPANRYLPARARAFVDWARRLF